MQSTPSIQKTIGILGGGQLGKMLLEAAMPMGLNVHVMESDMGCPAYPYAPHFTQGDIRDYQAVVDFGRRVDVLTIEIENVNLDALRTLAEEGVEVFPSPDALTIIKDKGLQKDFYKAKNIPTAPYTLFSDEHALRQAILAGDIALPIVQKLRTGGYDGKGVQVLHEVEDLQYLLKGSCIVEHKAKIKHEIAIIVAINPTGQVVTFPEVEMYFHPTANLVEYLFSPSSIPTDTIAKAKNIAIDVAQKLDIVGLLAVELFVNEDDSIWVNEVAPRPHNSGHHTMKACDYSQYDIHLRAILDLPLVDPRLISPAVMINLLGHPDHRGPVRYEGLHSILRTAGVYPYLYGKKMTSPYRKMGHITVVHEDLSQAISTAQLIRKSFFVKSI